MSWKPIQIDQPVKPVCKNRNRPNIKCRKSCCKRVRALQQNPDSSEQQSLFYKEGPLQQLRNWRNYPESN